MPDPQILSALQTLGLRYGGYDAAQLKARFSSEALRLHPDRGGSDVEFVRLSDAYKVLKTDLKKGVRSKLHEELKLQGAVEGSDRAREQRVLAKVAVGGMAAFHGEFEAANRIHVRRDAEDGYGEWMSNDLPDGAEERPLELGEGRFEARFASEFERRARVRSTSMVVRAPPVDPVALCTLCPGPSDESVATEDFSGRASGLEYTDIRVAHGAGLIDPHEAKKVAHERRTTLRKLVAQRRAEISGDFKCAVDA